MKMQQYLFIVFFVAFAVFLGCVNKYFNIDTLFRLREGFASLNPANYGCADVLLDGVYKINTSDPVTSCETYESQSRLYPVLSAHSLETNNINPEQWKQPNNGTGTFPELTGVFYN